MRRLWMRHEFIIVFGLILIFGFDVTETLEGSLQVTNHSFGRFKWEEGNCGELNQSAIVVLFGELNQKHWNSLKLIGLYHGLPIESIVLYKANHELITTVLVAGSDEFILNSIFFFGPSITVVPFTIQLEYTRLDHGIKYRTWSRELSKQLPCRIALLSCHVIIPNSAPCRSLKCNRLCYPFSAIANERVGMCEKVFFCIRTEEEIPIQEIWTMDPPDLGSDTSTLEMTTQTLVESTVTATEHASSEFVDMIPLWITFAVICLLAGFIVVVLLVIFSRKDRYSRPSIRGKNSSKLLKTTFYQIPMSPQKLRFNTKALEKEEKKLKKASATHLRKSSPGQAAPSPISDSTQEDVNNWEPPAYLLHFVDGKWLEVEPKQGTPSIWQTLEPKSLAVSGEEGKSSSGAMSVPYSGRVEPMEIETPSDSDSYTNSKSPPIITVTTRTERQNN